MTRRMLIDASESEETRVVVMKEKRLEEFDYDSESKKQLKGNVYLAKVTRVEPSLQAAFVEYGGNRHGFLAFNEIHPDYYKIPVADREQLIAEEAALDDGDEPEDPEQIETVGGDELEEVERRRVKLRRRYKIQEVIKRGQVLLVQVVKEERGNKGAALTTYLSLPGRYCVLMPNTARGGGISRKITNLRDRKRLKKILDGLGIPDGMAVIVRTAGSERTKAEIKRDLEYMLRLWDTIRTDTLESTAPALIYEEANLIKRAIRDMYTKEIDEILIDGDTGYRVAKDFMRTLMPSHAKRVQPYKKDGIPIFQRFQVEGQIDAIHSPDVKLRSGGYIVLHQTEALVAIDVNSGRSTRERHIEETALKTNIEAADEIARQLRLRDLAGLIVIDFIDMEETRNNHSVERRLKDALRTDRARIQVGRISPFGLLEMSRQRLRPSLMEMSSETCPYCGGSGYIRSVEWTVLHAIRAVEEEALSGRATELAITMPAETALYLLNNKRTKLNELEARYEIKILVVADNNLLPPNFSIDIVRGTPGAAVARGDAEAADGERPSKRKRRSRRRRRQDDATPAEAEVAEAADAEESEAREADAEAGGDEADGSPRRRKRGRRGGRRRSRRSKSTETETAIEASEADDAATDDAAADDAAAETPAEEPSDAAETEAAEAALSSETEQQSEPVTERPKRRRKASNGKAKADSDASEEKEAAKPAPRPRRRTSRSAKPKNGEAAADAPESVEAAPDTTSEEAPVPAEPTADPIPESPAANHASEDAGADTPPPAIEPPVRQQNGADDESSGPDMEPEESKEKRTGWWNRVLG